nr:hypothetical protein [Haladaptatus halobius]
MDVRPLELDDIYDVRRVSDCSLSPDGDRVAFVVTEADEDHRSLFVVPTDASDDPHRLTRLPGVGSPKWSPDGTKLGFVASRERDVSLRVGREDDAPDEPKSQVWVFDLERSGDTRQVTDREGGIREFDWGPESDRLVVSARDPTEEEREYLEVRREEDAPVEIERLQHKADGQGWLDGVTSYLFVVDVETRAARRRGRTMGRSFVRSATVHGRDSFDSTSPATRRNAYLTDRASTGRYGHSTPRNRPSRSVSPGRANPRTRTPHPSKTSTGEASRRDLRRLTPTS